MEVKQLKLLEKCVMRHVGFFKKRAVRRYLKTLEADFKLLEYISSDSKRLSAVQAYIGYRFGLRIKSHSK